MTARHATRTLLHGTALFISNRWILETFVVLWNRARKPLPQCSASSPSGWTDVTVSSIQRGVDVLVVFLGEVAEEEVLDFRVRGGGLNAEFLVV